MDLEKVVQDLNRRFSEPLPAFYKRRIIFWYDEDKEFQDKLDSITLNNAKIVALNGHNSFAVKKLLNVDDIENSYLIYVPFGYKHDEENWLLDMELYGEHFRADLISIWMDEMGLPTNSEMRRTVKQYNKFFNAKERRSKLASQLVFPQKASQLHLAVMGVICGLKKPSPNDILKAVLLNGLDNQTNALYQALENYGANQVFWEMAKRGAGYDEEDPDLRRLFIHIMLTALTRTIPVERLSAYKVFLSEQHQAFCYDLAVEWIKDTGSAEKMFIAACTLEEQLSLRKVLAGLHVNEILDTEIFPCAHTVILEKLMTDISNNIVNVELINKAVESRKLCCWYDKFEYYYNVLQQVANMHLFQKNHGAGFHAAFAKNVWEAYTKDYYMMDGYYRSFYTYYSEVLKDYNPGLQDLAKGVKDFVENLYSNWFLAELGANWSDTCAQELKEYGKILEVPEQADFYRAKLLGKDNKMFVIISDALRFEIAASLTEQLRRETKCEIKLNSMQALFPTITPFGMAALLPHKKLTVEIRNGKLAVLADGMSTESNNREKVLQQYNTNSSVLQAKNLFDMKREERNALVRDKKIVYIYHDRVDQAGHVDEKSVFSACEEAIKEIKNLVRMIVNDFGSTNIIITADHGFLYTYAPLKEDSKVDKTKNAERDVEYGRRYAIMKDGSEPEHLLPVKFIGDEIGIKGFAPRESIRIKMNGAGLNFVHGGISLQEMVVPVIEYHYLRNASSEYKNNKGKYDNKPVTIELLSHIHKISNINFSLSFFQKQSVGENLSAATYNLVFTDSEGKKISEPVKLVADKTSKDVQERTFRVNFNLKSQKYKSTDAYYLVMTNEADGSQIREEFQIDLAFGSDEFDFFS